MLGIAIIVRSASEADEGPVTPPSWRAMVLIVGGLVVFGLTVRGAGLVPATFLAALLASLASRTTESPRRCRDGGRPDRALRAHLRRGAQPPAAARSAPGSRGSRPVTWTLIDNLALGLADGAHAGEPASGASSGVFIGTLVGVLPGIGPTATIAMLLPVTFTFEPVTALIMLAGIYYGAQYGGSTTAILINLPGETSSAVTAIDGHEMARAGGPDRRSRQPPWLVRRRARSAR